MMVMTMTIQDDGCDDEGFDAGDDGDDGVDDGNYDDDDVDDDDDGDDGADDDNYDDDDNDDGVNDDDADNEGVDDASDGDGGDDRESFKDIENYQHYSCLNVSTGSSYISNVSNIHKTITLPCPTQSFQNQFLQTSVSKDCAPTYRPDLCYVLYCAPCFERIFISMTSRAVWILWIWVRESFGDLQNIFPIPEQNAFVVSLGRLWYHDC